MAKKYFKKKNRIKKGSDLPPGTRRLKGLGNDVIPKFKLPTPSARQEKEDEEYVAHISGCILEDIYARRDIGE